MSEISNIYHASNSIDDSAQITRSIKTERSNADQSNTTVTASNSTSSDAEFNLFDKNMRNFISSNRLIKIDLKTYIDVCMKTYWKYSVYDHDLYNVMRDDFENFNIEIWKFVSTDFWSTIHKICYTQNVWINLSCAANEKRADCITIAFVFEFYEIWIEKQILHVKKKYKKFSSIIQKQWKKMKKRTTKRKITAISTFSNSDQRFENVIFIDLTTVSKTDFEHITKRHIEQSFDDASSADDLIDQSTKRNWKHLFAANNTISFVQNTRNQDFRFSSHWTTNRQLYEINWKNRFDQNLRDVKNDSLFAWKNQFQNQRQFIFQSLSNRFQMYQRAYESIQSKIFQSIQSQINQQQIFQMQQTIQSTFQSTIQSTIQQIFQSMTQSAQSSVNQSTSNQQLSNQTSSNQLFSIQSSANQSFKKSITFYFYELTQLNKTYKIEKKFDKTKNKIRFKFAVFYNKCRRVELSEKTWNQIASIMLKNQALIFYYNSNQNVL